MILTVLLILAGVAAYWAGQLFTLTRDGPVSGDLAVVRDRRGDDLFALAGMLVLAGFSGFYYRWWLAFAFLAVGAIIGACAGLRHYRIIRGASL